jgi:two-component sensor histidine kinase
LSGRSLTPIPANPAGQTDRRKSSVRFVQTIRLRSSSLTPLLNLGSSRDFDQPGLDLSRDQSGRCQEAAKNMNNGLGLDGGLELLRTKALLFQRERELTELNHRIANSLAIVAAFLNLHKKRLSDGAAKNALSAASGRISAVAKLHHYLYAHRSAPEVNLKTFLEDLCPDIARSTGLTCQVDAEPVDVSGEMAQQLAIVVNEFAINASKHAYGGEEGGPLKIEARRDGADHIRVSVADGGPGVPDGFDPANTEGLGLSIISMVAKQLDAELFVTNDHGARFTLRVPVPKSSRSDAHIPILEPHMSHPQLPPAPHDQGRSPAPASI